MLRVDPCQERPDAIEFCELFVKGCGRPRYVMGRDEYARSIGDHVDIDRYIDDYTDEVEFAGKPVVSADAIPENSMVVTALFAKPMTGRRRLNRSGFENVDYFLFKKYSKLSIKTPFCPIFEDVITDFAAHEAKYQDAYSRLADKESLVTFAALMKFRLSSDIRHMENFVDRRDRQYFEPFLRLRSEGEVFVDVGGFDGFTTSEFIKRCPDYRSVHFFEPDDNNLVIARKNLSQHGNIHFHHLGLSDRKQELHFEVDVSGDGSGSRVTREGGVVIRVDALDDLVDDPVTFIKMDVEGAEGGALAGCRNTILKCHPRLAVAVYHRHDDLWKIPEQVLSYRNDYKIYLRHYTEGSIETVMYFVPDEPA